MIALRSTAETLILMDVDIIYVKECGEFREVAYSHKNSDKFFIVDTVESCQKIMDQVIDHQLERDRKNK